MAIRVRKINGTLVALCAAKTQQEDGDLYFDDAVHHALSIKFDLDFNSMGFLTKSIYYDSPEADIIRCAEES